MHGTSKIDVKVHMHEMYTKATKEPPQGELLKGSQATSIMENKTVPNKSREYETLLARC